MVEGVGCRVSVSEVSHVFVRATESVTGILIGCREARWCQSQGIVCLCLVFP